MEAERSGQETRIAVKGGEVVLMAMHPRDVEQVAEIEQQSFPTPWSRRAFLTELMDNAYAHYIVARWGGKVVGYAGMWLIFDEAHITNLAVNPRFRSRGIGDGLLSELIRRARARGIERMTLEVRPSNPTAQALYRKHGFISHGRRRGYYTDNNEDAIIMWKEGLEPGRP